MSPSGIHPKLVMTPSDTHHLALLKEVQKNGPQPPENETPKVTLLRFRLRGLNQEAAYTPRISMKAAQLLAKRTKLVAELVEVGHPEVALQEKQVAEGKMPAGMTPPRAAQAKTYSFSGGVFNGLRFDHAGKDGISISPGSRPPIHQMPREAQFELIKADYTLLEHASLELRNNKVVVLHAMTQNTAALQFASEELQQDELMVMIANGEVEAKEILLQFESMLAQNGHDKWSADAGAAVNGEADENNQAQRPRG